MSVFNVFCPLLCGSQIRNIETHLKVCKNKGHLNKYYFQCPYNPNHICSKNVFPIHKESCPDKKEKNQVLSSDKLNHNESDSPIKSIKIIKSYYSAPFPKKDQIIKKNGTPKFLTEEIENEKINITPEKKDKKYKKENENEDNDKIKDNITPNKAELLFNYNDNLSTGKKKILLKPTPMKTKNKTNLLNHNDMNLKNNYQLNNSNSEKKLLEGNKSNDSLKIALAGKLKRKLNFDDSEMSSEKDYSSIYSARTDISSDSSLKNIKKRIKKKVNFNKKIKVYVYSKQKDDDDILVNENKTNKAIKKCKSDIRKSNSEVFIEIYSKFL